MSHKKFGPDRFSRFDDFIGYKQTNRQNRQAKFIYRRMNFVIFAEFWSSQTCQTLG